MKRRHQSRKPSYDASMSLCSYIKDGNCTQEGIESRWHKTFSLVLAHIGPFPRDTRRYMWDELVSGNWERLHLTDEERRLPPEHWLEELRSDVFYCSDRWSLDRLTRCHWLYRAYVHACWSNKHESQRGEA